MHGICQVGSDGGLKHEGLKTDMLDGTAAIVELAIPDSIVSKSFI